MTRSSVENPYLGESLRIMSQEPQDNSDKAGNLGLEEFDHSSGDFVRLDHCSVKLEGVCNLGECRTKANVLKTQGLSVEIIRFS